ncbi:ATP-binding cassette domain-containing protein [Lacticaseibacillus jixiensis]|uniref:ATP-binding cassette domain-containing protein n=1 Tax=Lacticaseibacillus jixiensis TaxID=3231926 RepID=UPI0036F24A4F
MDNLTVQNVSYRRNRQLILDDMSFSVAAGHIVGLLGANGVGKTSLMRVIAGAVPRFDGTITVNGQSTLIARKAAVSASFAWFDDATNLRLSKLAQTTAQLLPSFDLAQFQHLAAFLDLDLNAKLTQLSKGNQKKARLAFTLAKQANVYLLDEPFDGIDSMTRKQLTAGLLQFLPEMATVLISDHHLEDITALIDRVLIIKAGQVVADDDTDHIRQTSNMSLEAYYESFFTKGGDGL